MYLRYIQPENARRKDNRTCMLPFLTSLRFNSSQPKLLSPSALCILRVCAIQSFTPFTLKFAACRLQIILIMMHTSVAFY